MEENKNTQATVEVVEKKDLKKKKKVKKEED